MRIAVLGTGMVGRALSGRLSQLGHDVVVGTRDPEATRAADRPDPMGNPPFARWHAEHGAVDLAAFADAGDGADLFINATSGAASLEALAAVGEARLEHKVLLDVTNPLDFSTGEVALFTSSTDSLAERIQRQHPTARVVKSLNTMNANVMVEPSRVPGRHVVFVAGNHDDAKADVTSLLVTFGWEQSRVLDLGGLSAARGMEAYLMLWLPLRAALGTSDFNIDVVGGDQNG